MNVTGKKKTGKRKKDAESKGILAEEDYQLSEALNLLKGLHILNSRG